MFRKPAFGFVLALALTNAIGLAVHLSILSSLGLPLWDNMLVAAYGINAFLALGIGLGLYRLRKKFVQSMGFIFLAGTALKFLVFFLVFNPIYKEDGVVERTEFITFFIPYVLNLVVETTFLVRVLNKIDEER